MKTIKNSKELAELVNKNKDLIIDDDITIEFEPTGKELIDVKCRNLTMEKDGEVYDFNCCNFFGRDFKGRDFNGLDFTGRHFNGHNFTGCTFTGKKVSYYASFVAYGNITCESIKARRPNHAKPIALDGEIIIKKSPTKEVTMKEVIEKFGEDVKIIE